MATTYLGMTLPDVSITAGPLWATQLNAALTVVDSHDHTSGKGQRIVPAAININAELTFNDNPLTNAGRVGLYNNPSTLASSILNTLYASGGELYFNDGAGNQLQLTDSGSAVSPNGFYGDYAISAAQASYDDIAKKYEFDDSLAAKAILEYGKSLVADGTVSLPSFSFTSDPDTGFYLGGAGNLRAAVAGADVLELTATGADVTGNITVSGTVDGRDIAADGAQLDTNTSNIATNTASISTNAGNISTNTANIATNTSNIATNTSNISTNTSNISTNTSNISTNTANIATNTSDISTINTNHVSQSTGVHGVSGSVVGTTDAQTLTNKTLSAVKYDEANVTIASNTFAANAATINRITSGSGPLNTVTGAANGDLKIFVNETGSNLIVADDSAADGFYTGSGQDLIIQNNGSFFGVYDTTTSRWNVIGGAGGGGLTLTNVSASGSVAANNHYLVDSSGGALLLTLPAGSQGSVIRFSDVTNTWDTNNVIVAPSGAETIDGDAQLVLDVEGTWVQLMWDGTEWKTDDAIVPTQVDLTGDVTVGGALTVTDGLTVDTDTLFVDSANGRVGIGTTSPSDELHIESSTGSYTGARLHSTATGGSEWLLAATNDSNSIGGSRLSLFNFDTSAHRLVITNSGNVGIGNVNPLSKFVINNPNGPTWNGSVSRTTIIQGDNNLTFEVRRNTTTSTDIVARFSKSDGTGTDVRANGTVVSSSDKRVKENITDYTEAILPKLNQLKFKTFNYINSPVNEMGLIAQEVYNIFPHKVITTDDGTGSKISEGEEPWKLERNWEWEIIKAIQELKAELDQLKEQLNV